MISLDVLLWTWCIGACAVLAAQLHTLLGALLNLRRSKIRPQWNYLGIAYSLLLSLTWPVSGLVALICYCLGVLRRD